MEVLFWVAQSRRRTFYDRYPLGAYRLLVWQTRMDYLPRPPTSAFRLGYRCLRRPSILAWRFFDRRRMDIYIRIYIRKKQRWNKRWRRRFILITKLAALKHEKTILFFTFQFFFFPACRPCNSPASYRPDHKSYPAYDRNRYDIYIGSQLLRLR